MTGRGIDQVLPYVSGPRLHEDYVRDARDYVRFAEACNGPIPLPVDYPYIWGDALDELTREQPDARIVNLETSVTRSDDYWQGKGINYRMHPGNVPALTAARLDLCVLANNHVLDYGYAGLRETLDSLRHAGLRTAGAGWTAAEAREPATIELRGDRRLRVLAFGLPSSGIPALWAATDDRPGVCLLGDLSPATIAACRERIRELKRPQTTVIVSIHWGGNWGYEIPAEQVDFAHRMIDAGADVIHGHSSHHVRPIEVYRNRLILYGCGDFITDYEGIGGYEHYRGDLAVMYFPSLDPDTGALKTLRMAPMHVRRFRVGRASPAEAEWLRTTLSRVCGPFHCSVVDAEGGHLALAW
jgi:poly-gamma-glutamate synthesis protein (capsule biosynthesis protein)